MQLSSKRGFALLITIVLLGFLVLLLVSLSALTRVETQVASNSQQIAQARQNALFGLNVALGQLQKFAGPDQRVSATADLTTGVTNPHYTGIWNVSSVNGSASVNAPLAPSSPPTPTNPNVWLVSGNEIDPISVNQNTDTSDVSSFETLVGPRTATEEVRVKKMAITSNAAPGIGSNVSIGHYAYWVGDEGVKAKITVVDPYAPRPADGSEPAFFPTNTQTEHRLALAQRFGIEQMVAATGERLGAIGFTPTANNASSARLYRDLGRVLTYANTSMALPAFDENSRKARYHDITTRSFGLLSDTVRGGLKLDLTWELSQPRNTADPARLEGPIFVGKCADAGIADQSYWPLGAYDNPTSQKYLRLNPRWSVLRDFYQLPDRVSADGTIAMAAKQWVGSDGNNTAVNNAINPVFVQLRIYLGAEEADDGVYARTYFMLLLANPYNARLSVPANSLCFRYWDEESSLNLAVQKDTKIYQTLSVMKQFPNISNTSFVCDRDLLFEPGETIALTLPSDVDAANYASTLVPLRPGVRINAAFRKKLVQSSTSTNPSATGWRLTTSVPNNRGWLEFWMKTSSDVTLQHLRFLSYFGGGTRTGVENPFKIGGFFATVKMPGEPGYADNRSLRFLTDHNLRAQFPGRFRNDELFSFATYFNNDSDSYTSNLIPTPFWGLSTSEPFGRSTGSTILFDIPRRPAGAPLSQPVIVSLGQLQHANIANTAQQPAYAIGNSYASLYCQPERSISVAKPVSRTGGTNRMSHSWFYDMSYLLNEALWDRYYFSTVPQPAGSFNPASDLLTNSRHVLTRRSGALPDQAALTADAYAASTHLLVNGAFNVNSTSVNAWKAVFSSLRGVSFNGETNLNAPFFRSLRQTGGSAEAGDGQSDNTWTGFRDLTSNEVDLLSEKMVEQVRLRGPFRSLGDFVNRRLLTASGDPNGLRLRGALQAAIDAAGINAHFDSTGTPGKGNDTSTAYADSNFVSDDPSKQWMIPENAIGNRATGAPGWLMQADILQALGPVLTPRSDTFVIRAYGETVNPITAETVGRAWCEAVVQRTVDYIDASTSTGNQPADAASILTPDNQAFGRRFKIVGFRWLTPNDL